MQNTLILSAFLISCAAVAGIIILLAKIRQLGHSSEKNQAALVLNLQHEIALLQTGFKEQSLGLSEQINRHLSQNTNFISQSQNHYQQTVTHVQNQLGQLQQATHSMIEIGKDISSLQDILRAPKLRGGMGELFLGELLHQILPAEHYELQHSFRDGSKVDAVIHLGDGIIPVDAKFPLENFRRILEAGTPDDAKVARKNFLKDVKIHIDTIAKKYILPDEETFEFALMYIPAENIYYETIIKEEKEESSLSAYALSQRVIPVSPNSFYAYLQAIARGLRGLKIENSAKKILENLGHLETSMNKVLVDVQKTGSHLSNAQASYERVLRGFDKLKLRLSVIDAPQSQSLAEDSSPSPTSSE